MSRLRTYSLPILFVLIAAAFGIAPSLAQAAAPPAPTITSGPDELTNEESATFTFVRNEPGGSFQCAVDSEVNYHGCSSPETVSADEGGFPREGEHTFFVRHRNSGGEFSAPATYTWTVDTIAPERPVFLPESDPVATIPEDSLGRTGIHRDQYTNTTGPITFSFQATEPGGTIECGMGGGVTDSDGIDWQPCDSLTSHTIDGASLSEGGHLFNVREVDDAGNSSYEGWLGGPTIDDVQAAFGFTVDRIKPDQPIWGGRPDPISTSSVATFSLSLEDYLDAYSTFWRCKIDDRAWSDNCGAFGVLLHDYQVGLGPHIFEARLYDEAGNYQEVSYSWTRVTEDEACPLAGEITGFEPNPVEAGHWLSILGTYFGETPGLLLIDGEQVAILPGEWEPDRVDVVVPLGTAPGVHTAQLQCAEGGFMSRTFLVEEPPPDVGDEEPTTITPPGTQPPTIVTDPFPVTDPDPQSVGNIRPQGNLLIQRLKGDRFKVDAAASMDSNPGDKIVKYRVYEGRFTRGGAVPHKLVSKKPVFTKTYHRKTRLLLKVWDRHGAKHQARATINPGSKAPKSRISVIAFGKAGPSAPQKKALKVLRRYLDDVHRAQVNGYTNSIGSTVENKREGAERAKAVKKFLVKGLSKSQARRITTRTMGESRRMVEEIRKDGTVDLRALVLNNRADIRCRLK